METVSKLKSKLNSIKDQLFLAQNKLDETAVEFFKNYFGDCLQEDDKIVKLDTRFQINRYHPQRDYCKEIFTVYLHQDNVRQDIKTGLEINYYTTSASDPFEWGRLVSLGEVAHVIATRGNLIKESWDSFLTSEIAQSVAVLTKQYYEIVKQLSLLDQQANDTIAQNAVTVFYRSGITFVAPIKDRKLIKDYDGIVSIVCVKVNRKTVDVQVNTVDGYIKVVRVQASHIESLVKRNAISKNIA